MLAKEKNLIGYTLVGVNKEKLGKVKDFYFDDQHWTIRYIIADTGNWLNDKQVLLLSLVNFQYKTHPTLLN